MKITIVAGSHRPNSESERVARYIEKNLHALSPGDAVEVLALAGNPLPLWDEGVWSDDPKWQKIWTPISAGLKSSDAFIIVSPEWGGMVPAGLKNFFLLCTRHELAHKPALIVGVSSGMGGAYPISELRVSSGKNSRICYIPDHVIVRQSGEMLKGDSPAGPHDEGLRKRIAYSLSVLLQYSRAFKLIRESGVVDLKTYPYGM